jgi:hypothetical protein
MTGLVMGTPGYLSPEGVDGEPVTEATDWWGWAATLAFAASGAPPFGRGPMQLVLDRVHRGQADLAGIDQRLAPLLQAALSPIPTERPHAEEIVHALNRYAAGAPPTIAIAVTRPTQRQQGWWGAESDQAEPDQAEPVQAEPDRGVAPEPAWDEGLGLPPDPRVGSPSRVGTLLALLLCVLGVATIWPMVAIGILVVWSLGARFADRAVTSLLRRRVDRGRRRTDIPRAIVVSPWHVVVAAVATVLTLVIPAIVAIGSTFAIALAAATVTAGDPEPGRALPVVAGGFLGLLLCWWGPGGASLRRGSRSLVRAVAPGKGSTDIVVATFFLLGVGLGAWAWVRNGQPDWWPWSPAYFEAISGSFW